MRHMRSGFTLTELMAAVAIVGILAAMAVPNYRKMVELGYLREAQDLLMTVYNGERAYSFSHNGQYYDVLVEPVPSLEWRTIYTDNPNLGGIPVNFTVTVVGGTTFTATATRSAVCTTTINQNRVVTVSAAWIAGGPC